ncbi:MAG TPA: alkaline phosphatase family protein [Candidatus Competibacteraceae bacterium]|nr:alkaline phosphatase family protein [Candidatus Competibacteraceae bacterium]
MSHRPLRKVLFLCADQWRGECLSALGHPTVQTPNLDRLAQDGVLFRRHYSQVAPCGPARTSLLTGLYAMNHRSIQNGTPLARRHSNLALEARKGGYEPILFGYTDSSADPRQYPPHDPLLRDYGGILPGFREGFRYDDEICLAWMQALRRKGYVLPADLRDTYVGIKHYPGAAARGHSFAAPLYRAEDSDTAFTADQILEYLELRRHKPWFVHGVFLRPHPPLFAPEPYNALYHPDELAGPIRAPTLAAEQRQHPFLQFWLEQQARPGYYTYHHGVNVRDLPEHEIRQMRASYYGLISEVDTHIGRLLDHLQRTGEYDETLIVFTVDHGEQLGDHWLWGKGGYFEQSYHIPLIIRDPRPGAARGRVVEHFTEAVDIVPTILEWLGLEIPAACDGVSLLPFLQGETPHDWRTAVHWEYDFRDPVGQAPERALGLKSDQCTLNVLRGERYKYVHFTALPPLFFDLQEDPWEFRNLAADPAYQGQVLEYAQKLLSLRMNHAERTLANTMLTEHGVVEHRGPRR